MVQSSDRCSRCEAAQALKARAKRDAGMKAPQREINNADAKAGTCSLFGEEERTMFNEQRTENEVQRRQRPTFNAQLSTFKLWDGLVGSPGANEGDRLVVSIALTVAR